MSHFDEAFDRMINGEGDQPLFLETKLHVKTPDEIKREDIFNYRLKNNLCVFCGGIMKNKWCVNNQCKFSFYNLKK